MVAEKTKRILELGREYRSLDDKLRSDYSVRKWLGGSGLRRGLSDKAVGMLANYKEAVFGLYDMGIPVDRSLIDLLGKSSGKKGSINYTDSDYLVLKNISCVGSEGLGQK